ncbi:MAG: hypothetical protein IJ294_01745 [Clostridia bacterium]|nr:hypothetical protein [Clostridia bacterium]MBR4086462.1 hypothetical protein [Clostridia bacterium]
MAGSNRSAKTKRIYLLAGHYGSGKTNIAVNLALKLKAEGHQVRIADLDIVNPYFRTKDSADALAQAGIPLISPAFANTNVDLPALPAEVYGLVQQKDSIAIMDIGGDDRGAYALGRYAPAILEENDYEMCYVANFYRPLTPTPQDALEVMREIEQAAGIPFTAIIHNSNLGNATDAKAVEACFEKANQLAALSGLPILYTAARADLCDDIHAEHLLPLTLQDKYYE